MKRRKAREGSMDPRDVPESNRMYSNIAMRSHGMWVGGSHGLTCNAC